VLLTTATAPDSLTASLSISSPCKLPLNPSAGLTLPGTTEGDANDRPPSFEWVNPSPWGRCSWLGNSSQTT
jgi:hypothetical protein